MWRSTVFMENTGQAINCTINSIHSKCFSSNCFFYFCFHNSLLGSLLWIQTLQNLSIDFFKKLVHTQDLEHIVVIAAYRMELMQQC